MTDEQFADLKAEVTAARAAAEQAVRGIAMLVRHLGAAPRPVVSTAYSGGAAAPHVSNGWGVNALGGAIWLLIT